MLQQIRAKASFLLTRSVQLRTLSGSSKFGQEIRADNIEPVTLNGPASVLPPELALDAPFEEEFGEEDATERLTKPQLIDRIIRVDHAGEYGANRIYSGQHIVLQNTPSSHIIREMWKQEVGHLSKFESLMKQHSAKPTALLPFWDVAGFALGAATALMGKEAAMACTVAIEEAIGEHYNNQIRDLLEVGPEEKDLLKTLKEFRDDELEHLQTGLDHDAEQAPFYESLRSSIKTGCKAAIWASERV